MGQRQVRVGASYKHYKGGEYKVLNVAKHTETGEELVIYQDKKDPTKIWARPLEMFVGLANTPGGTNWRFVYIGK